MAAQRKSHQTTIRFSEDLWQRLEAAAFELEVSVAQYVREAARARLEMHNELPAPLAHEMSQARADARERVEDSTALWEQGRQARLRASQLREQSARERERRLAEPVQQERATEDVQTGGRS